MKVLRRTALGAALVATAATAAVALAPTAAQAASCPSPWWTRPDGRTVKLTSSVPMRTGPYSTCTAVTVRSGTTVVLDCFLVNSYGNYWSHITVSGIGGGWVYDPNLPYKDGYQGALGQCGY
jgi:hypothetical protein